MSLSWTTILQWIKPVSTNETPKTFAGAAPQPTDWNTDSRSIKPGDWFVPIVGETFDGHDFIEAALKGGAAGFLFEPSRVRLAKPLLEKGIAVTDTLAAYQHIAAGWRSTLTGTKIAAITGSVGKTTTKEMIRCVFGAAGSCFSTTGSFNNEIGVPKSILQIKQSDQFAILEFGAKRLGNIKFLCDMAKPNIGILINVGVAHLGIFGSIENLLATKLEIFRDSSPDATLVANADDERILEGGRKTGKDLISFGYSKDAQVRITKVVTEQDHMKVTISYQGNAASFKLHSCHEAFPLNAAAAISAGLAAGISLETTLKGIESFQPVAGRFRSLRLKNLTVIDDSYNANPDSMKAGISSVFKQFSGKKITLVLGDMLELGDEGDAMHEDIGKFVANFPLQRLYCVGPLSQQIEQGYLANVKNDPKSRHFSNIQETLSHEEELISDADVIFIKGSNGVRLMDLVKQLQEKLTP